MGGAASVEEWGQLLGAAYQAKDADAVADLYEDDAILANSVAGYSAVGRAAIVENVKDNFRADVDFAGVRENKSWVIGDDCVIGHSIFDRRRTLPDGTVAESIGRGTMVFSPRSRRQVAVPGRPRVVDRHICQSGSRDIYARWGGVPRRSMTDALAGVALTS
jgi:ketosteroid isomerase-like protein